MRSNLIRLKIAFSIILLSISSFAQVDIESIIESVDTIQDQRKKTSYLLYISEYFVQDQPERSLGFAEKALTISLEIQDSSLICDSYKYICISHAGVSNCDQVEPYYLQGITYALNANDSASILTDMGAVYTMCGNLQKAEKTHRKAKEIFSRINDQNNLARLLINMGVMHSRNAHYYQASKSYLEALEICVAFNDDESIAVIYQNMGEVMSLQNQYDKAVGYYTSSINKFEELGKVRSMAGVYLNLGKTYIDLEEWDIAKFYLNKSYVIDTTYQLKNFESIALKLLGITYLKIDKLESARTLINAAVYIQEENGYLTLIPETKTILAEVYIAQGNYREALKLLNEAQPLAEQISDDHLLAHILELKSAALSELHQYKEAYSLLKLSNKKADSIFNLDKTKSIMNLELAYQTEIKEKQIDELKYNESLQKEQLKSKSTQVYLLIVSMVLSIFVLLSMLFFWRRRQQIKDQKREQIFLQTRFEAEERAKDEIARELHDDIGGQMIAMILQLQSNGNLKEQELAQMQNIYKGVRRLSHSLDEPLFDKISLQEKVRNYLSELKAHVNFSSQFIDDFKLPWNKIKGNQELQRNIYRIIQELISNTIKHANATEVDIQIINESKNFILIYEDNGIGITDEEMENNLNFNTIKKRLEMFGGQFKTDLKSADGFFLTITIPFTIKNSNLGPSK